MTNNVYSDKDIVSSAIKISKEYQEMLNRAIESCGDITVNQFIKIISKTPMLKDDYKQCILAIIYGQTTKNNMQSSDSILKLKKYTDETMSLIN